MAPASIDPVAFRLDHLSEQRLIEVVKAVPSLLERGVSRRGVATGCGMACVLHEGDNGYCAFSGARRGGLGHWGGSGRAS